MFKPMIAPLLAASLAVSPMAATPARADSELGKVVAGIALLAIIGNALQNNAAAAPAPAPVYRPRAPQPTYGQVHRRELPARCRETLREAGRNVTVFGKHCLKQNMRRADRLPASCERKVKIFGKARTVFGAQCLRRNGWPV